MVALADVERASLRAAVLVVLGLAGTGKHVLTWRQKSPSALKMPRVALRLSLIAQ